MLQIDFKKKLLHHRIKPRGSRIQRMGELIFSASETGEI